MVGSRSAERDETDFLHYGHRSTGLHHLHGHRAGLPAEHVPVALDLPPTRATGAPALRGARNDCPKGSQTFGMVTLLVVAALWGSYGPVLKFLFSQPSPPSAALVTACQALLAAAFLLAGTLGAAATGPAGAQAAKVSVLSSGSGPFSRSGLEPLMRQAPGHGLGLGARLRHALRSSGLSNLWLGLAPRLGLVGRGGVRRESLFLPRQPPESVPHCHSSSVAHGLTQPHATHHHAAQPHAAYQPDDQQQYPHQQHQHQQHQGKNVAEGAQLQADGSVSYTGHAVAVCSTEGGAGGQLSGPVAGLHLVPGSELGPPSGVLGEEADLKQCSATAGGVGAAGAADVTTAAAAAATAFSPLPMKGSVMAKRASPGPQANAGLMGHAARSGGSNLLALPLGSLTAVGLELGTYNFCAVALGTWGVQCLSATKVAFLGQATSLITPLLVALSGQRVAGGVWVACGCGVLGGLLVAIDGAGRATAAAAATAATLAASTGAEAAAGTAAGSLLGGAAAALGSRLGLESSGLVLGTSSSPSSLLRVSGFAAASRAMRLEGSGQVMDGAGGGGTSAAAHAASLMGSLTHNSLQPALSRESMGVNYVLASCLFYALGTVRLGVHSGRFPPLQLAAAGAVVYAVLAVVWLLAEVTGSPNGGRSDYLGVAALLRDNAAVALVLWAGFGPGALSSYLQVVGQRIVPAAQAQMLYSSTPLWSALIARLLLRGRDGGMGAMAWLGGALMLSASLVASLVPGGAAGAKAGAVDHHHLHQQRHYQHHRNQQQLPHHHDQQAGLSSAASMAGVSVSQHSSGGAHERHNQLEDDGGGAEKEAEEL